MSKVCCIIDSIVFFSDHWLKNMTLRGDIDILWCGHLVFVWPAFFSRVTPNTPGWAGSAEREPLRWFEQVSYRPDGLYVTQSTASNTEVQFTYGDGHFHLLLIPSSCVWKNLLVKAKFHYVILVADSPEAVRRKVRSWLQTCSELEFDLSSSSLAAS